MNLIILIIIITLSVLLIYFSTPAAKGKLGEQRIANMLETSIDKKVLRNIYVPKSQGGTTEVDLVYITPKGLFVIESKNYAGYIFGNDTSKNWTVTLNAGKKVEKIHFYNPIWQNNTHIKCIKEYLGKDIPCYSLVVFSNRGDLKSINVSKENTYVIYNHRVNRTINSISKNTPDVLSLTDIEEIYTALSKLTDASREVKEMHINDINERLNNTDICPSCGGKLILRTAKKGASAGNQFYGCENFPKCRYIKG